MTAFPARKRECEHVLLAKKNVGIGRGMIALPILRSMRGVVERIKELVDNFEAICSKQDRWRKYIAATSAIDQILATWQSRSLCAEFVRKWFTGGRSRDRPRCCLRASQVVTQDAAPEDRARASWNAIHLAICGGAR